MSSVVDSLTRDQQAEIVQVFFKADKSIAAISAIAESDHYQRAIELCTGVINEVESVLRSYPGADRDPFFFGIVAMVEVGAAVEAGETEFTHMSQITDIQRRYMARCAGLGAYDNSLANLYAMRGSYRAIVGINSRNRNLLKLALPDVEKALSYPRVCYERMETDIRPGQESVREIIMQSL